MILNRPELEEAAKRYDGKSAGPEKTDFLFAIRCFRTQASGVVATEDFCHDCDNYKHVCEKQLKLFKIREGREVYLA
jgi:hypothetical protein